MQELKYQLEEFAARCSGEKSFIIEDLDTGESVSYNETLVFPAASLIKLPVLLALFRLVETGTVDLDKRIPVPKESIVQGFGIIKELEKGLCLTYRDLAVLMIILSDNTASNMLIDLIGKDTINGIIRELGMQETVLGRKMMDIRAKEEGFDNFTSARDVQTIFKTVLKDKRGREMVDILLKQQCNNKLPALMGENVKLAHKTGDLPGTEHDAGILFTGEKSILIIVLTKELTDNQEGVLLNNEIGKLIYQHYNEQKKQKELT